MLRRCLAAAMAVFVVGAACAAEPAAPYHVGGTCRVFHPQVERHWRGARTNVAAFEAFCGGPQGDAICRPPEMDRLQPSTGPNAPKTAATEASLARSGASYRDARIKAVFAIAPALGMALDTDSLRSIALPVSLMAGDADVTVPVESNVRRIAGLVPNADVLLVPGASHYTFIDTCHPGAVPHLPLLCQDKASVDRDVVHAEAVRRALDFFRATLPAKT